MDYIFMQWKYVSDKTEIWKKKIFGGWIKKHIEYVNHACGVSKQHKPVK